VTVRGPVLTVPVALCIRVLRVVVPAGLGGCRHVRCLSPGEIRGQKTLFLVFGWSLILVVAGGDTNSPVPGLEDSCQVAHVTDQESRTSYAHVNRVDDRAGKLTPSG
jgi:hypothetical protein